MYYSSNVIELLVCTLFGSEAATEIPLAVLEQPFCFCSVELKNFGVNATSQPRESLKSHELIRIASTISSQVQSILIFNSWNSNHNYD